MPESGDVTFSSDNIMMTFSPLMQTDDGLYQCVVDEGSDLIQSIGYEMQVNCKCTNAIAATLCGVRQAMCQTC